MSILPSSIIAASVRDNLCPTFVFPSYCSPPLPVLMGNRFLLAFLIGRGEVTSQEEGFQIWAPTLLAFFEPTKGSFVELRSLDPKRLKGVDTDEPMQKGFSPPERGTVDYINKQTILFQHCDQLASAFLEKEDWKGSFQDFDNSFRNLVESKLVPFYELFAMKKLSAK